MTCNYSGCQMIKGRALSTELIITLLIYLARKIRAEKQVGNSNWSSLYLLDDN